MAEEGECKIHTGRLLEYARDIKLARMYPHEYLLIVFHGAYQRKVRLTHFATSVKDQRGRGMSVHLIGLLNQGSINRLRLFTKTKKHSSGANRVIEVINYFSNEFPSEHRLHRKFIVQLDNCWWENKNQ